MVAMHLAILNDATATSITYRKLIIKLHLANKLWWFDVVYSCSVGCWMATTEDVKWFAFILHAFVLWLPQSMAFALSASCAIKGIIQLNIVHPFHRSNAIYHSILRIFVAQTHPHMSTHAQTHTHTQAHTHEAACCVTASLNIAPHKTMEPLSRSPIDRFGYHYSRRSTAHTTICLILSTVRIPRYEADDVRCLPPLSDNKSSTQGCFV